MVESVADVMTELEPPDFHLLSGVEHGMRFGEWVDRTKLPQFSRLTAEEVDYRLDRALERGLIERRTLQYEGYRLTFEGYDALALHTFAERGTVEGFGAPLGVGKESDVFEVQSYRPLALKFHREGVVDFREVNRERSYTADRDHVSWLYTARKAAEREYDALETLYPEVSVPRPVGHNRHAVVMGKLEGVELSRAELDGDPLEVLDLLIRELRRAYEAGRVHADVSEYNVAVGADGITLFDWPQAVPASHENAEELLQRDVANAVGYFERKYPEAAAGIDTDAAAAAVADGSFETVHDHT